MTAKRMAQDDGGCVGLAIMEVRRSEGIECLADVLSLDERLQQLHCTRSVNGDQLLREREGEGGIGRKEAAGAVKPAEAFRRAGCCPPSDEGEPGLLDPLPIYWVATQPYRIAA